MLELPTLVANADWSVSPAKRWMAYAELQADDSYLAHPPCKVDETATLITRLKQSAGEHACLLVGFDLPIGLPLEYAQKAGITDFLTFLLEAGRGRWKDFYIPAAAAEQICLERPFYPRRPGGSRRADLLNGLGVGSMQALMRQCELAHEARGAACPIFWTMGGQQVGKAAICGWQEVLAPGLREEKLDLSVWPFSGRFEELLRPGRIVVTETYPREFYAPLEITFQNPITGRRSGKRDPVARRNNQRKLIGIAEKLSIHMHPVFLHEIMEGFGADASGEDRFDAAVGLFGMINVLKSQDGPSEPGSDAVRNIEGWIFGQK